ncbi:MAG: glycerophosphodiester phosphodiesterase family protein [Bdellovibrionales bacterium]
MALQKIDFFPPIIAHRGAPLRAPENTIESFVCARDAGAKWIETDVTLTSDGIPVLMHDETLDRTTNGHGPIAEMTWEKIQQLDAGSWFSPAFAGTRVTSLTELMAFCTSSRMRLVLELKPSPGRTQATVMVTLIEACKLWPENAPPPMVGSFDVDALMISAQLRPDWPRGLFLEKWRDDWIETAFLTQASTVTMRDDMLTPERLPLIKNSPFPLLAYTINDKARMKELLKNGIKAVFSDNATGLLNN